MSNARAARRRAEKAAKQHPPLDAPPEKAPEQKIQLQNPVEAHYAAFAIGNALKWEATAHDRLIDADPEAAQSLEPYGGLAELIATGFKSGPAFDRWQRFRRMVEARGIGGMVQANSAQGQHVVICGAGPSLAEEAAEWCPKGDQVWGCNSALPWLVKHGHKVTHGLTVDQTADMLTEWITAPDVPYMVCSTVHPHLSDYLLSKGRELTWFHNFVGIKKNPVEWPDANGVNVKLAYEDWLYVTLFPGSVRAGSGLNTVTRAIDVALYMGFDQITVLGADCAMRSKGRIPADIVFGSPEHTAWLKENTVFHADGGHALSSNSTPLTLGAMIDDGTPDDTVRPGHGRWWESKIDLLISARWLLVMERAYKGRINIVGDTYVKAIRGKNAAYLKRLPAMLDHEGNDMDIVIDTED